MAMTLLAPAGVRGSPGSLPGNPDAPAGVRGLQTRLSKTQWRGGRGMHPRREL